MDKIESWEEILAMEKERERKRKRMLAWRGRAQFKRKNQKATWRCEYVRART